MRSTSPISWSVLPQCRSSTAYISEQKAASLTKNSPKYSAPACSITKKQLVDGLTKDTKTVFRMPTSPRGWVLSKPPHHNQSGGQLRPFQYVNSGWFRSNMDGTPFGSGSQSLQTRRVKSGQIVDSVPVTSGPGINLCPRGSTSNHRCCATATISGWPGTV